MSHRQDKPVHLSENVERKRKTSDMNNFARELFYSEEKSVLSRDIGKDVQSHQAVLDSLASIIQSVKTIKCSKDEQDPEELERLRMEGMVHFAALKKMNRLGHLRSKCVREQTQEAKQRIDEHYLKLQNLLYEIQHLQREIHKCLQFQSKHESISLVSQSEFQQSHPEKVEDDHKLMLSRMDWELKERIRLSEKLETCKARKEELLGKVALKKRHLSSLQPKLQTILAASQPLQEDLNLRLTEERAQLAMVPNLPPPLHLLFIQASSLSRYVKGVGVEIVGDRMLVEGEEEAFVLEESESEDEGEKKKGKHQRRVENKLAKKRQEFFKTHPLAVVISSTSSAAGAFQLTFHHFSHLRFVSVAFNFTSASVPTSHPLFSPLSFISNLFRVTKADEEVEDCGDVTPNAFNTYVFNKLGIDDLTTYLTEQVGRPYKWAQALCGLDALMLGGCVEDVKSGGVEGVLKLVAERISNRLTLYQTIESIGKDFSSLRPHDKHQSQLTHFSSISKEEYLKSSPGRPSNLNKHFLYAGCLKHPDHQHVFSFTTAIPYSYPTHPCFFTISLPSTGGLLTSTNHQAVRELECAVNTPLGSSKPCLLTSQLSTLCAGFEALLHRNPATRGPIRSLVIK